MTTSDGRGRPGRLKRWCFRLIAMTVIPLLFFLLVEGGLRVAGVGYPTGFFVASSAPGHVVTNDRYGWRFFPRAIARAPLTQSLSRHKAPGTYRIFILGGSAAMGYPDPAYSFGRVLEIMLEEAYPETDFEVFNAAMTAINSHVVRLIADDCADLAPDLFVVYLGNNEVVGPYGPGTAFAGFSPSRGAIAVSLWVKTLRLGQLIDQVTGGGSAGAGQSEWRGLEMFVEHHVRADDEQLQQVYEHLRANLTDICESGLKADAEVILCTVGANLRDNPPFASVHQPDLATEQLREWDALVAAAASAAGDRAIELYREAQAIDDAHAELAYRLARALEQIDQLDESRQQYALARDLDALRFRADSRINDVIRAVASELRASRVSLADAARALATAPETANGVPGAELFHEHVHMTFAGNYRIAASVFETLLPHLPPSVTSGSLSAEPPSMQRCREALALTPWNELSIARDLAAMITRPPFTSTMNTEVFAAEIASEVQRLQTSLSPESMSRAIQAHEAALEARPDDVLLHLKAADITSSVGDHAHAVGHWESVIERIPEHYAAHNGLGLALASIGRPDEGIEHYQIALKLRPGYPEAHNNMGMALVGQGKTDQAIEQYRLAIAGKPRFSAALYNLGLALKGQGKLDEAVACYRQALEVEPGAAHIHNNLANILQSQGRSEEAISHFVRALQINPKYVMAHRNLALTYRALGRLEEAVEHLEAAVEIRPDFEAARRDLQQTKAMIQE